MIDDNGKKKTLILNISHSFLQTIFTSLFVREGQVQVNVSPSALKGRTKSDEAFESRHDVISWFSETDRCVCVYKRERESASLPECNPLRLTRAGRGQTRSWTSSVCSSGCSAPIGSLHSDSHSCKQNHRR